MAGVGVAGYNMFIPCDPQAYAVPNAGQEAMTETPRATQAITKPKFGDGEPFLESTPYSSSLSAYSASLP
ncbi:hypothetical protein GCM10017788_62100 [Amycolatopsis acidiphila]|nr:hypothetical protein GCM10017788_62100 [Amycolatopsis acidiphila]